MYFPLFEMAIAVLTPRSLTSSYFKVLSATDHARMISSSVVPVPPDALNPAIINEPSGEITRFDTWAKTSVSITEIKSTFSKEIEVGIGAGVGVAVEVDVGTLGEVTLALGLVAFAVSDRGAAF